jgi:uncharacterized protein DUF6941
MSSFPCSTRFTAKALRGPFVFFHGISPAKPWWRDILSVMHVWHTAESPLTNEEAAMVTELFVICDGANDFHGKLNILGAFDMIVASQFPFVHPHCAIVLRQRYNRTDSLESKIRLLLQNVAGDTVLASIDTVLQHSVTDNPTSTANLIVNINAVRFEKPGDYSVILQVDGIPAAITPLYVRSTQTEV